jgi:hypothetical protein
MTQPTLLRDRRPPGTDLEGKGGLHVVADETLDADPC